MHIVEYLDPKTKQPTGQYAKRSIDPNTGKEVDEIIPKRCFCVCDAAGNIVSISEINYSHVIEMEGKEHCMELSPGQECPAIIEADMPAIPEDQKHDKLKWLLDNHKMGAKDANGKRKIH